ncbi:hypothetical protein PPTG_24208 [Phytophthora nicotianae INRA-310]|uniref:Uncharacterized protein n=1 Tax=Phytophthora nicotianae (strain INRA-310) TaxID=761204 RepID=W2PHZ2_PHYN3|nr:hypothetical protein PPTG_24208 [Phytophthora nicotianae INRA-310]ETN00643.1 hypothetical protein PPTG_24208 [Phytophthora nicotianae INRA-310]
MYPSQENGYMHRATNNDVNNPTSRDGVVCRLPYERCTWSIRLVEEQGSRRFYPRADTTLVMMPTCCCCSLTVGFAMLVFTSSSVIATSMCFTVNRLKFSKIFAPATVSLLL